MQHAYSKQHNSQQTARKYIVVSLSTLQWYFDLRDSFKDWYFDQSAMSGR